MAASPFRTGGTGSIAIPERKDGFAFDPKDLSVTPGGSIYGTTPGGTRIKYDRETLLFMRNSPLSRTPPAHLPAIPGVTTNSPTSGAKREECNASPHPKDHQEEGERDTLFNMED